MDDRLRLFLWLLGGAGFFGLLGALFGGLAGAVARKHGQTTGGLLGRTVADSLARVSDRKMSEVARAALVGATDGAFFLSLVGGISGAVVGYRGDVEPAVIAAVCCGVVLLAVAAVCLGLLAYGMVRAGVWAIGGVFAGAILFALVGHRLAGADGLFYGTTAGAFLGILLGLLTGPARRDRSKVPDEENDEEGERGA